MLKHFAAIWPPIQTWQGYSDQVRLGVPFYSQLLWARAEQSQLPTHLCNAPCTAGHLPPRAPSSLRTPLPHAKVEHLGLHRTSLLG